MQTFSEVISDYRQSGLQGSIMQPAPSLEDYPHLEWFDFILVDNSKSIIWADIISNTNFHQNEPEIAAWLNRQNYEYFLSVNPTDSMARAVIFGTLIAANIAIRSHSREAYAMKQKLKLLLEIAINLPHKYQNNPFFSSGESQAVIKLINLILQARISTTALVFQANIDCCHPDITPVNRLNVALVNFYHDVITEVKMDKCNNQSTYSDDAARVLFCQYLNLNIKTIVFNEWHEKFHSAHNFAIKKPLDPAFTLIMTQEQVQLLLDSTIYQQMTKERPFRSDDFVMFNSVLYLSLDLDKEDHELQYLQYKSRLQQVLDSNRRFFYSSLSELLCSNNNPSDFFSMPLLCDTFHSEIRVLAWILDEQDVLCELEEHLAFWNKQIKVSAIVDAGQDHQASIQRYLQIIYDGHYPRLTESFVLLREICYIGGQDNAQKIECLIESDEPLDSQLHQSLVVILKGINRTTINVLSEDSFHNLEELIHYVECLLVLGQTYITPESLDNLRANMRVFFQSIINQLENQGDKINAQKWHELLSNAMQNTKFTEHLNSPQLILSSTEKLSRFSSSIFRTKSHTFMTSIAFSKDRLDSNRNTLELLWSELIDSRDITFISANFSAYVEFFHEHIRRTIWTIDHQDVLFELEERLILWSTTLTEQCDVHEVANEIKSNIDCYLNKIYSGDVPPLLTEPSYLNEWIRIGGNNHNSVPWRIECCPVSPQQHQALMVIVKGLNRLSINPDSELFRPDLMKLIRYIQSIQAIDVLDLNAVMRLKESISLFFQGILNRLESSICLANEEPVKYKGYKIMNAFNQMFTLSTAGSALVFNSKMSTGSALNNDNAFEVLHDPQNVRIEPGITSVSGAKLNIILTRSDLEKAQVYRGPLSIFSDPNASRWCSDLTQETEVISGSILTHLKTSATAVTPVNLYQRLPDRTFYEFKRLQEYYKQNKDSNLTQSIKFDCLNTLERIICNNPSLSFTRCRDEMLAEDGRFRLAITKKTIFGGGFWGQHQLLDLITQLIALDPPDCRSEPTYDWLSDGCD